MKLGQQTAVHFLSQVVAAVVGTLATIYIARELGSDAVGVYFLALAVVSWAKLPVLFGLTTAISKRLSEGDEQREYALSGVALISAVVPVAVVLLVVLRDQVAAYVGSSAIVLVIGMFLADVYVPVVSSILVGRQLTHVSGLLSTLGTVIRAGAQIGAVVIGLGVTGLLGGYAFGWGITVIVGTVLTLRLDWPATGIEQRHARELLSYAKYSWLGDLRGQVINWVDILVLGFFVSPTLVGIYGVAWNLTRFLMMFGDSISTVLFPKISNVSGGDDGAGEDAKLVTQALAYTGLFLIPGLFGGVLLGGPLLRIYGTEFARGDVVLTILLAAAVMHGYQSQVLSGLNAVDRPEFAFRSNSTLIGANVVLNVVLVWWLGWIGAALATACASGLALVVTYGYLRRVVSFTVPLSEIGRQVLAAVVMAAAVLAGREVLLGRFPEYEFVVVLGLVCAGAGVYFAVLLLISEGIRETVFRNLGIGTSSGRPKHR
jgi:O-antigen/teichoic acid export membrane protein